MTPLLEDYKNAVSRLEEILVLEKNPVNRDSAIKRFELCFDLAWKSIKNYAREDGWECYSPRACIRAAFQFGLIEYDEKWLDMIDDRNKSAHIYKEILADQVYLNLKNYLNLFKKLLENIQKANR